MTNCLLQTPDEIVTEISMSCSKLPWLILEGDTDGVFFSPRKLPLRPVMAIAKGWENVVAVVSKVIEESVAAAVYGFVDRDYREHLGLDIDESCIVVTDFRDLEISLFESSALHRVLVEIGSSTKLPCLPCGSINIETVKSSIYRTASVLGRIRYYSLKNEKNYCLSNLNFSKFIDPKNLSINEDNLIAQICSVSSTKMSKDDMYDAMHIELPEGLVDTKYLCSGHDVAELLGISLRRMWGSNNSGKVDREEIESKLRIGYSDEEFSNSLMYDKLCALLCKEI